MWWLYILGACGITIILVMSRIMKPLREAIPPPVGFRGLEESDPCKIDRPIMLACTLCTGVWVGAVVGAYACISDLLPRWTTRIGDAVLFAFAAALLSYFFGTWLKTNDKCDKK